MDQIEKKSSNSNMKILTIQTRHRLLKVYAQGAIETLNLETQRT